MDQFTVTIHRTDKPTATYVIKSHTHRPV